MKFIAYQLYTWAKDVPIPTLVIGDPTPEDLKNIRKTEDIKCISEVFEIEEKENQLDTYDEAIKAAKKLRKWKEKFKRKYISIAEANAPDFLNILPEVKSWRDQ